MRLMQYQNGKKRPHSILDDGENTTSTKRPRTTSNVDAPLPPQPVHHSNTEMPKILPGERLRDFAARVDHALPVAGLRRKGTVKVEGIKERQTRTEKRLQKMYAAWRVEDARRKEQEEERLEREEEEDEENEAKMGGQSLEIPQSRQSKRRQRMIGEQGGKDDDPWAELKLRRDQPKGLHDVAQAPPSFQRLPREKFKVKNGAQVDVANIPAASGSLKRREELSDARREVIERYRAMMKT
jgi:hypothetical protein